jgi:hypothetical protein
MHENIFTAFVGRDEPVTAHIIESHNFASQHRFSRAFPAWFPRYHLLEKIHL